MSDSRNMPPRDVHPVDLWAQITTLPRAHRVVPFPRNSADGVSVGNIAIVVLDSDDVMLANINAEKFAREQYKKIVGEIPKADEVSAAFREAFNARATREILFRSCYKADECQPDARGVCTTDHAKLSKLFPSMEAIGKLSTDETAVIMRHYMQTQAEVGPIVSNMSQVEMDAWIEVLGKGGGAAPLALLSSDQANALMMYMACRLCSSPMDSDSPGTLHENIT